MMTVLNKRQLNNRGASVIELLIIMAIIAVLLSGSIIAFTLLNSSNVKQAARTTKDYLEKTRTSSMSVVADEWYFKFTKSGSDYKAIVYKTYTKDGAVVEEKIEEKLLGTRISATFISDGTEIAVGEGDVLKIVFDRSSGEVKEVLFNTDTYAPHENIVSIKFTSGSNKSTVNLYFVSGKVELE